MKAILVIDIPDDFETKTAIAIVDVKNEKGEGVTAMRPLKPMPEKKQHGEEIDYEYICIDGWNACIEELEK